LFDFLKLFMLALGLLRALATGDAMDPKTATAVVYDAPAKPCWMEPAPAGRYGPDVERWRCVIERIATEFGKPPSWVDKALYVIAAESRGNPEAIGDSGSAVGLFQVHHGGSIPGRPPRERLLDPEFNIRFALTQLGPVYDVWTAWGEGVTYNGAAFGALGGSQHGD
jgi:soluble lytic murein transglycosylase-like protein